MSEMATDYQFMARAIKLAQRGAMSTSPNPCVGCVIVKDGRVLGEGWHQKAGEGHAEVNALASLSEPAIDATAYVTLEPCSHFGRTPPCAQALIDSGIKRVVVSMKDPNPLVSGKGIEMLTQAGIDVTSGVMSDESAKLNVGFLYRMTKNKPWIQVKLAASIDGKTALANGKSQWITSPQARVDVQKYRAESCAILSGADTVIMDNARLNVRHESFLDEQQRPPNTFLRQPVRIIIDSQHRLTPDLALFSITSPIWLIKSSPSNQTWPAHVQEIIVPKRGSFIDLSNLMNELANRQINKLWVEAGATLAGAIIDASLANELILYQAPKILGSDGKSLLALERIDALQQAKEVTFEHIVRVGPDIKIVAKFN